VKADLKEKKGGRIRRRGSYRQSARKEGKGEKKGIQKDSFTQNLTSISLLVGGGETDFQSIGGKGKKEKGIRKLEKNILPGQERGRKKEVEWAKPEPRLR